MTEYGAAGVDIPHTALSPDALRAVLESFVLREGTDYGRREYSLEEKVAHVRRQLERHDARIVFDPDTGTVDIVINRPPARSASTD
ncbi:MAG TPA: YheU family protein [Steroidobacteraceae bacterium]|jgi:hypothetical protein